MTTILVFDTETTDAQEPELIEAGGYYFDSPDGKIDADSASSSFIYDRYKPTKPIAYGAMATHHILEADLIDCPPSSSFAFPVPFDYMVGHNVDFDWKVVGEPNVRRICTLAMSRWLFPNADSHTLSAMLYRLTPADAHDLLRDELRSAHNALKDCELDARLLGLLLEEARKHAVIETWADLWEFSEHCRVPTHMSFGKHKGMAIKDVLSDYKAWLLKQDDVDPYLRKALLG